MCNGLKFGGNVGQMTRGFAKSANELLSGG